MHFPVKITKIRQIPPDTITQYHPNPNGTMGGSLGTLTGIGSGAQAQHTSSGSIILILGVIIECCGEASC